MRGGEGRVVIGGGGGEVFLWGSWERGGGCGKVGCGRVGWKGEGRKGWIRRFKSSTGKAEESKVNPEPGNLPHSTAKAGNTERP